jgi:hypothetical protein
LGMSMTARRQALAGRLFNAEIRGRKIGDTFPDQSSIFPVFLTM